MARSPDQFPAAARSVSPLADALRAAVTGDVRFDALSRTLYSTDASIYEIIPEGVVLPRSAADVTAMVRECQKYGTTIVARGAGTGLTGGAVGPGVQLDVSRYMNGISDVDVAGRTVRVEPGVVLDELNAHLAPHGLQFGPDVATSSRATLGGMIANNSCGAHSLVYGRTVDHVLELSVVLADGEVATFGRARSQPDRNTERKADRATEIERELGRIRDACHDEIERRFPKVQRSNGGYGLDRLGPAGTAADAMKVLCGSEGTLGIVVSAKLNLVPIPRCTGLVVLHFDDPLEALGVTPAALAHNPAAVELVDRLIIEGGLANPAIARRCDFLEGDPRALLIVEFLDDDAGSLASRMDRLLADKATRGSSYAAAVLTESEKQEDVWNLRKSGLGLLMSKPGDSQPIAFVEDTAVAPARLREYIERFQGILRGEGVDAGYYAHAGGGCIHVRPVLNLKTADDVEKMRRIAEAVSDLVLEFGGAVTGEHGDGIARSPWIEKIYGSRITAAFQEVKQLFDPGNLLNPHKIVDALPMIEHLRYGPDFASRSVKTLLDFSSYGGLAGLAGMCNGVGQCRQRLVGTMCPSYQATGDEKHTTRARANALRIALSNRGLLDGLDDPYLAEVMDLCIACKACKTECPTGVDMARLRAEYLSRRNLTHGVPPAARLVADMPKTAALASRFPRISNLISRSRPVRAFLERRYGFDRRITPPRFAHQTFRAWFRRHQRKRAHADAPRGMVVYFVDTWTNYFAPQVGKAAVKLLERAGFRVHCPQTLCCGRPAISKGLLTEAKQLAQYNVRVLSRIAAAGVPILGTEPSCILTLVDEYPQLHPTRATERIASQAQMIESFLCHLLEEEPSALKFKGVESPLLYHAHCHQKAIVGADDAISLLKRVWGASASLIDCGCCGMAGSFGYEKEHYEVSRMIGEQRLFPAIRDRGDACVALSGFSCRQQIEHHTDVQPRHVVEYLADALE